MHFHPGLEMGFTDRGGRHWIRDGDGSLTEVDVKPINYYKVPRPISWSFPRDDPDV